MRTDYAALAFRRHHIDLPDWVNWVWMALGVIAVASVLVGWWRSTRPADHGATALARVRKQQKKKNRKG